MTTDSEQLKILEMIENGLITAEEGIQLLNALETRSEGKPGLEAAAGADTDANQIPSGPSSSSEETLPESIRVNLSEQISTPDQLTASFSEKHSYPPSSAEQTPYEEPPVEDNNTTNATSESLLNLKKWHDFWQIPFLIGVAITMIGGGLMNWAWQAGRFSFWFACAWFPFLFGVLVLALAWSSRTARWLHLRIHQKSGQRPAKIAISFPIPLRLTAWFLRTFGHRIPNLKYTGLDELLLALEKTSPDTPFYIEVNEGNDGEKVEVYIG
jgi:hypothetical protein